MRLPVASLLLLAAATCQVSSFQPNHHRSKLSLSEHNNQHIVRKPSSLQQAAGDENEGGDDLAMLKRELTAYLEKRKEVDADSAAKEQVGRVVGGTKGNPVLDYVSGSPNKEYVIEEAPNVFDYDELGRYGYGDLVTTIMKNGGRNAMYDLFGMERPAAPQRLKPKSAPKLVIDKEGATDKARYSGLKMGQVMDDDVMAQALEEAQRKAKSGESLRPKIEEEDYIQPFADKRNTGPKQTPLWTAEKLDEYGAAQGRAEAWARQAKMGEFVKDPEETLDLPLAYRAYAIFAAFSVAFSFGRSTPTLLAQLDMSPGIQELLQAPALAVLVASLGSAIVSGVVLAPSKNRNSFVWGVKGLLAGPLAVANLRGLDDLVTREETELRNQQ